MNIDTNLQFIALDIFAQYKLIWYNLFCLWASQTMYIFIKSHQTLVKKKYLVLIVWLLVICDLLDSSFLRDFFLKIKESQQTGPGTQSGFLVFVKLQGKTFLLYTVVMRTLLVQHLEKWGRGNVTYERKCGSNAVFVLFLFSHESCLLFKLISFLWTIFILRRCQFRRRKRSKNWT